MINIYCVIQELQTKKTNPYGYSKFLETYASTFNSKTYWSYRHSEEKFIRPHKKAYKISIHESKRINGVVTKKQCSVTTINYYSLAEYGWYDCINENILKDIADTLNITLDDLYEIIEQKIDPLVDKIRTEFESTEEYITHKIHQELIQEYNRAKNEFAKLYEVDASEYDYCYDLYGKLMNKNYLDKIRADYKAKRSYQEKTYSNYKKTWEDFNNKYGSYSNLGNSNHTSIDKDILKKFYRALSKSFHPDNAKDDGKMMKLVNQLKEEWGI